MAVCFAYPHWNGSVRHVYFEEGGYFDLPASAPVQILAQYEDGKAAALQMEYGQGRVSLSFPHPEALETWKVAQNLSDPDGDDTDLVAEMVRWLEQ